MTCKKPLDDLKRSANLGRDEYPQSLTEAFEFWCESLGNVIVEDVLAADEIVETAEVVEAEK